MCNLCRCIGDSELCVDTLRTKLGNDGLNIPPEQRDALLEMCNEIKVKIRSDGFYSPTSLKFEDSKEGVLHKKYKEIGTCVLRHDVIDWKQVEEKLGRLLLEYESAKSDELRFGIKSITWLKIFRTHDLSISPEQRDALLEICKEIEKKVTRHVFDGRNYLKLMDTKENVLKKKYIEFDTCVLQNDVVDWKQVEGKLRQLLLEYDSAKSDEFGFGLKSTTWHKVFRTREQSIPEPIRNCLNEMCKEIEEVHYSLLYRRCYPSEAIIRRYETLGHDVLEMEIVDWEDIRKLLKQILVHRKREHANQSIIVEDLDGQQHIINTNGVTYTNDVDYLVRQVAHTTGISKSRFVLVYKEKLIVPGKHFYIPNGAKIQLLPVKKNQKPPTDLTTYVRGLFNGIYGQIHRLFTYFPKVFEDTTRLLLEKDFVRISQLIGEGWGLLGIELGLSKVKLQQITEDKQNVVSRIFEMLSQWSQTRKDGATAGQLLSAVMKSGVCCDFNELKRVLLVGL